MASIPVRMRPSLQQEAQGPGGRFTEDGGDLGGNHRGQSRDREAGSPRTGATSEASIGGKAGTGRQVHRGRGRPRRGPSGGKAGTGSQ